jgi:hypothetical protein
MADARVRATDSGCDRSPRQARISFGTSIRAMSSTGGEIAPEVEPFLPVALYCDPSVFDAGGADAYFAS